MTNAKTLSSVRLRVVLFIVSTLTYASAYAAAPIPATGTLNSVWTSYSGTTSGIVVDIGSGPVNTGLLSFTLDDSFGADNFFNFNWDTQIAAIRLHLIISSPFIDSLSIDPLKITINETGTIDTVPLVVPDAQYSPISGTTTLLGGGTVTDGLFAGFTFENSNPHTWNITVNVGHGTGNTVQVGNSNTVNTQQGTITPPGGTSQNTSGTGAGVTVIPEASTMAFFMASLAGLAAVGLRSYRRLKSKSGIA